MSGGVVRFLIIAGAVVLLGALLLSSSCSYVAPGSVGVLINRTGGGVSDTHLDAGFHLIFPFTEEIEEYPVYMQTLVLSRDANEGTPRNEEINVPQVRVIGSDGEQIGIMVTRDAIAKAFAEGM